MDKLTITQQEVQKNAHNIGYPPAGTSAMTMITLYLKKATQTQIPLTNPAGG
jgi:hypothetical protein